MRETLLAFLALSIVTTMSLGIMSASLQNSIKQVDREVEVYASAVGAHVMDYIGSRSYDQRTTPNEWLNSATPLMMGTVPDSAQYALAASFGSTPACNLFEPYKDTVICDDIGDVHLDSLWQRYDYVVEIVGTDTLVVPFEVNAQVSYVDASDPAAVLGPSVKTNTKKVTVTVRSVQHRLDNMAGGTVQLERLFSFDEAAAIAEALAAQKVCTKESTTLDVNPSMIPVYESMGGTAGPCP